MLLSLVNKATGEELLSGPAGLHLVRTEDAGMTAWSIGRYLGMEPVTQTTRVRINEGPLRKTVIFDQKVMNSTVYMEISLDRNADALRYKLSVDWHEVRSRQDYIPLLSYRLPLKTGAQEILTDVPGGAITRPARALDVPALTGACAAVEGTTAALITDCKYGFRLADDVLSVTLINTACDPDLYPERGIHEIKLFVAVGPADAACLKRTAETLIRPLTAVPTASHPGIMPAKTSLMRFDAGHSVMTSAQISADGALLIRLYEAAGTADAITIQPPFAPARAALTDLDDNVLSDALIADGKVRFTVSPYKIAQVKIYR